MKRSLFFTTAIVAGALHFASPASAQKEESELDRLSRSADDPFLELTEKNDVTPVSVTVRALNKITARYTDIEAPIAEIVEFGTLEIVPRFCDKRPPEEFPETTAFLQIYDRGLEPSEPAEVDAASGDNGGLEVEPASDPALETAAAPATELFAVDTLGDLSAAEKIFSGWMFASSPALNPLEHPVYDVWVIDCKTVPADK